MTLEQFEQLAKDVISGKESRWRALSLIRSEWFHILEKEDRDEIYRIYEMCDDSL